MVHKEKNADLLLGYRMLYCPFQGVRSLFSTYFTHSFSLFCTKPIVVLDIFILYFFFGSHEGAPVIICGGGGWGQNTKLTGLTGFCVNMYAEKIAFQLKSPPFH